MGADQGSAYGFFDLSTPQGESLGRGKWMNTIRKTASGWRIQCDIWNSSEPATAPAIVATPTPTAKSRREEKP